MQTSEKLEKLPLALLEFHKKVGKIIKSDNNPFFKSKYASLATRRYYRAFDRLWVNYYSVSYGLISANYEVTTYIRGIYAKYLRDATSKA
jgi:hypothetical protein